MPRRSRADADPSAQFASRVFRSHGLGSPRFWRSSPIPTDESELDAVAIGLCTALAKLGGLYGAFAGFLNWRADLLRGSYISHLRHTDIQFPAVPPLAVATVLKREFGALGEGPARALLTLIDHDPISVVNTLTAARMGAKRSTARVERRPRHRRAW